MPPSLETITSTVTSSTAGGFIPFINTISTGPTISSWISIEDKTSKSIEKIDEHVDHLEEDIDYFNRKLEQHNVELNELKVENTLERNINVEQNTKIKILEEEVEYLKNYVNYLEGRLMVLEENNDKMS